MYNLFLFLISSFIAIPVFLDVAKFSIIYTDEYYFKDVGIPVPIGFFAFSIIFLVCRIDSFLRPHLYCSVFSIRDYLIVFFGIILFFMYTTFVSELEFVRTLQLVFPLLFIFFVIFPLDLSARKSIIFGYFFGFALFSFLHLIYLLFFCCQGLGFNGITDIDFSFFFGSLIYQSLVTYNAVLSMFFFLSLFFLYRASSLVYRLLFFLYLFVPFSLLLLASRRISIFEIGTGLFFYFLAHYWVVWFLFKINRRSLLMLPFFIVFLIVMLWMFFDSPLYLRSTVSLEHSRFDSGRLEIYADAFKVLFSDMAGFLFGYGGSGAVGFHNYILDTIYRVGVFGVVAIFIMFFFAFMRIWSFVSGFLSGIKIPILILFTILGYQVLLNSAITQPYFFVNFLMMILVYLFYNISLLNLRVGHEANSTRYG